MSLGLGRRVLCVASLSLVLLAAADESAPGPELPSGSIDIPAERHVLPNGLTLVVHEDHDAPVVGVTVWYRVGSKDEGPGQRGFAHLVEHLMFQGTQASPGDYFATLEEVGAIDVNATTDRDRTAFFQTVPKNALDLVLWLESDRMANLLSALDDERIERQVRVIANEKRHREGRPFGEIPPVLAGGSYPSGHPYSWATLDSMEDLHDATREAISAWYRTHYGAANATVVVAGDVKPQEVLETVETYFGFVRSGPPRKRDERWIAPRTAERRQSLEATGAARRLYKVWNVPERGSPAADLLEIAADVLGGGQGSRLHRRLVDTALAVEASSWFHPGQIGSQLILHATPRPGVPLARLEDALDRELAALAREGPSSRELFRVQSNRLGQLVRRSGSINGRDGKAAILAESEVYGDRLDAWEVSFRRGLNAAPHEVQEAIATWLTKGAYVLEVRPARQDHGRGPDRRLADRPEIGPPPAPELPVARSRTLANGLELMVVERPGSPSVDFKVVVDVGPGADPRPVPGLPDLLTRMLWAGSSGRDETAAANTLSLVGAEITTDSSPDAVEVSLSVLSQGAEEALELLAELILRPSFRADELESFKARSLARIRRERASPPDLAIRLMPGLLYGRSHRYGASFSGSGTLESVSSITRDDLVQAHRTWFRPSNTTLVAVGGVRLEQLLPRVEELFSEWSSADPSSAAEDVPEIDGPRPGVYVVDLPQAPQTAIMVGQLAPAKGSPLGASAEVVATVLAGTPGARLPRRLREEKGWSYGAYSIPVETRGSRPLLFYTQVQADATGTALVEVARELDAIVGERPITEEELARAKRTLTLSLPARWEKQPALAAALAQRVRLHLPRDYHRTYTGEIRALRLDEVRAASREILSPDELVWLVIGDRDVVESQIRPLDLGEIRHLGLDGALEEGTPERAGAADDRAPGRNRHPDETSVDDRTRAPDPSSGWQDKRRPRR